MTSLQAALAPPTPSTARLRVTERLLYAAAVLAYVLVRVGSFTGIGDRVTDTASYEATARLPLWDWRFWAGIRGFTIPLFFKIVPGTEPRILAQLCFSTVAWVVLAASVALSIRHRWWRVVVFAAVLAFSSTTEVILWDTMLLSESITFALMALLIAAWLQLIRSPRPRTLAAVLLIALLWTFARDSNAYLMLVFAAFAAVGLRRSRNRRLMGLLGLGCCAIFLLDYGSAEVGKRWLEPMQNVVQERVLPFASLRTYFVRHGLVPTSNWPVGAWMLHRSRGVYLRYLVSHPLYTLTQPLRGTQVALYSTASNIRSLVDPSIGIYDDNAGHRFLPLPDVLERLLFPRGLALVGLLVLGALLLTAGAWLLAGAAPVWVAPLAILASTYPHFLVVWHQSGYEVDRHALEAALLLRLSTGLLAAFAVDRLLSAPIGRRRRAEAVGVAFG